MVICCSICQERLDWVPPDNGDLKACAIMCGHIFHFGCIKQWWTSLYEVAGPEFIQGVRCPICRHTNIPQFFDINFLFKDDDLFCTESEMNESIILQLNIEEIMEECKQIKKDVKIIKKDIHNEEKIKKNLRAELNKAMKEKNNFQALMEKKVQSIYTKQSLGQQTSSAVSKRRVKVPILLEESNKEKDQIHVKKIKKKTKQTQWRHEEGKIKASRRTELKRKTIKWNNVQALIRKKVQRSYTNQLLSKPISSTVSKDKVKVQVSRLLKESPLDYCIPNFETFIRIPQISGTLYDDIEEEEKEHEKNRLRKAMEEGVDWILIELCEFQIEPQKLISDAHLVRIFASSAGVCSIASCYIWPQYHWTYIPFTILKTIGAVYFYNYSYRLVSQYEVEKDKVQLSRFPRNRIPKATIVLRKKGNASIKICNFLTAGIVGIAFLYTCYILWSPGVCK